MAGFAHRNRRIGPVGHVQAERMQRVGEVIGLEAMTGDAGLLADGMRIIGEFVRTLPRKPGVYRMIGADGEVL